MTDAQAQSKVNPAFGHLRLLDYFAIVYCVVWILGEITSDCGSSPSLLTTHSMGTPSTHPYISIRVSIFDIELFRNQHPKPSHTNVRITAQYSTTG